MSVGTGVMIEFRFSFIFQDCFLGCASFFHLEANRAWVSLFVQLAAGGDQGLDPVIVMGCKMMVFLEYFLYTETPPPAPNLLSLGCMTGHMGKSGCLVPSLHQWAVSSVGA